MGIPCLLGSTKSPLFVASAIPFFFFSLSGNLNIKMTPLNPLGPQSLFFNLWLCCLLQIIVSLVENLSDFLAKPNIITGSLSSRYNLQCYQKKKTSYRMLCWEMFTVINSNGVLWFSVTLWPHLPLFVYVLVEDKK